MSWALIHGLTLPLVALWLGGVVACGSSAGPVQTPEGRQGLVQAAVGDGAAVDEVVCRADAAIPDNRDDGENCGGSGAVIADHGNVLHGLDKVSLPPDLESLRAFTREAEALLLFGCDVQGKRCRRISVTKTGAARVEELQEIAAFQPESLARCGGGLCGARYLLGSGNQWERVKLDSRLREVAVAKLPAVEGTNSVIPRLASDGALLWVLWNADRLTTLQLFHGEGLLATHRLAPPAVGPASHLLSDLSFVACGGRLHLLRGGSGGLEAILIDESGELHRSLLAKGSVESHAIAPVGGRFFAVWSEPNGMQGLHGQVAGRVKAQWLDSTLSPLGEPQVIVEGTPAVSDTLHLWADHEGRLALGRTDRWRGGAMPHHSSTPSAPVYQPGFQSASLVAAYDIETQTIGDWHDLGSAPILDGEWLGDTLNVIIQSDAETDDPFDPSRLKHFPPHVQRFRSVVSGGS